MRPWRCSTATDPGAVLAVARAADFDARCSSSAASRAATVETLAFYHYLAARADAARFVAITDPGSPLEALARDRGFRGGLPSSAGRGRPIRRLTVVGMLPAALLGVNGRDLLERALAVDPDAARARGARLARGALAGRDKLVLRRRRRWRGLAPTGSSSSWLRAPGRTGAAWCPWWTTRSRLPVPTARSSATGGGSARLGAEYPRLGVHTRELCTRLGVNAFDQPNVEEAKALARAELARGEGGPVGAHRAAPLATLTRRLCARPHGREITLPSSRTCAQPWDRDPAPGRARELGRDLGCTTTLGFGPRYLHSTGQLHKGGPNTGLFLVVTADDAKTPTSRKWARRSAR